MPANRTRLRPAGAVHARLFDEELVVLDLAQGEYFALDALGARLWLGLEAGRSVEEIARDLVAEYEVGLERLIADLTTLSDELVARGLMTRQVGQDG
ncbi:MAG: PqqD family protein [Myxococcales bacterium]|nr:PqqD family protein [Myxococcales bacterium]